MHAAEALLWRSNAAMVTLLDDVAALLSEYAYPAHSEALLEDCVAEVLNRHGRNHERQAHLTTADRADIWLPRDGIVIELKTHGSFAEAARQIWRYAALPAVRGVLLAAPMQWAAGNRWLEGAPCPVRVAWLSPRLSL